MWWVAALVVAVVLLGAYTTWVTKRVNRSHARAVAAYEALDSHLVRRAEAALAIAEADGDEQLSWAARVALDAVPDEREAAENDLTRVLRSRLGTVMVGGDGAVSGGVDPADVVAASRRVALARHVHSDLVSDALALRRRRLVRALQLARRHPVPTYFDIEAPALDGG
jgi:hypothetical protein